jgi:rubrerythrin
MKIFNSITDAFSDAPTSRRDALRTAGRISAGAALAAVPFYHMARDVMAKNYGGLDDVGILNYALTLEYLEAAFYRLGLDSGVIPSADRDLFATISDHETAHVNLLTNAINMAGGDPVAFDDDAFDFSGGDGEEDDDGNETGPFNPFEDYGVFLTLSQAFEDTGVRAYKGQAAAIETAAYLTVALQIHSVEARHAAAVRRLRGNKGWIPFSQPGAIDAIQPVYAGEANTTQGGINLATALQGYTEEEITEAFDEPLTMDEVLAIADPFIDG